MKTLRTVPQIIFAGYNELEHKWEVVIDGEIPVDAEAPIENGDEKDPDPIVRIFMPLKRKYIDSPKYNCCIAPYMPDRKVRGGQHTIVIGFIADFRTQNEDKVMSDFITDFCKELNKYIEKSFFVDETK